MTSNSELLKVFNAQLTDWEKQWYEVLAGYLLPKGKTDKLSSAKFTEELVKNGLIGKAASGNNNPAIKFLKKLEKLKLVTIQHNQGAGGNIVTLNFYVYIGSSLQGMVPWQHPLYIRRPADSMCEECLTSGMNQNQDRAFLKIKSPRYTGKTSLLIRLKEFANKKKAAVGFIDLESYKFPDELFTTGQDEEKNKEKYKNFLEIFQGVVEESFKEHIKISRQFKASSPSWSNISPAEKLTQYLEEKIFSLINKPKVLLIDGIDRILGTHIQDNFLRVLRSWVEEKMKKLGTNSSIIFPNIAIAFSTESYFDRESPLQNVGTDIALPNFIDDQILGLADLYGLVWKDGVESASRLQDFLGGKPYLINMALYEMSRNNIGLETLQQQALFPNSRFLRHLQEIVEKIKEDRELEQVFTTWLKNQSSYLDEKSKIKLAKLGAIEFAFKDNSVQANITCKLYEQYFKQQFLN